MQHHMRSLVSRVVKDIACYTMCAHNMSMPMIKQCDKCHRRDVEGALTMPLNYHHWQRCVDTNTDAVVGGTLLECPGKQHWVCADCVKNNWWSNRGRTFAYCDCTEHWPIQYLAIAGCTFDSIRVSHIQPIIITKPSSQQRIKRKREAAITRMVRSISLTPILSKSRNTTKSHRHHSCDDPLTPDHRVVRRHTEVVTIPNLALPKDHSVPCLSLLPHVSPRSLLMSEDHLPKVCPLSNLPIVYDNWCKVCRGLNCEVRCDTPRPTLLAPTPLPVKTGVLSLSQLCRRALVYTSDERTISSLVL
jgi:hypothetical protein